jgi:hypothetical protein
VDAAAGVTIEIVAAPAVVAAHPNAVITEKIKTPRVSKRGIVAIELRILVQAIGNRSSRLDRWQPGVVAGVHALDDEPQRMVSLALAFKALARAMAAVWRDPETKALPVVGAALVLSGTIFYWHFEHWTVMESLYFCIVTLTSVGYGDLHPTTGATQAFTVIYILTGIGIFVALLASVAERYIEQKSERTSARERISARRGREP